MRPQLGRWTSVATSKELISMADAPEGNRVLPASGDWSAEFTRLSIADREGALTLDDLERFALCAYLLARDAECESAWMRAHQAWLREGDVCRAARCAFWQACGLLFRGELAPALGWIARGRRVLEAADHDCAEQGWLALLGALPVMFEGDAEAAYPSFVHAGELAGKYADSDLAAFARLCQGQSLVLQGHIAEGMVLLDEVMVAVMTGELTPILTGIIYCSTIAMCQDVFDLRRAREWTDALSRWCDSQHDMVPFRGNCLIHRCEIFQLQGDWPDALDAAQRACELLAGPATWDTLGAAYYQLGEVQRLRGQFTDAEASYRKASRAGREPEPGMSLLRLAQGRSDLAATSIRRVLDGMQDMIGRSKVLPAYVEIMLAAKDLEAARDAADELTRIAGDLDAPYLSALAFHFTGAVLLAEGNAQAAQSELRGAHDAWRDLNAPYQAARVRVLLGLACRDLQDGAAAELEFDAARSVFTALGALPDLEWLNRQVGTRSPQAAGGLSPRESEVLELLASGKTNRAIAAELSISEKTVARHVSNIFTKLTLSSRAEATAYAYTHGLLR
jgi:DNA-binding CsgD family transcriptional regulator